MNCKIFLAEHNLSLCRLNISMQFLQHSSLPETTACFPSGSGASLWARILIVRLCVDVQESGCLSVAMLRSLFGDVCLLIPISVQAFG